MKMNQNRGQQKFFFFLASLFFSLSFSTLGFAQSSSWTRPAWLDTPSQNSGSNARAQGTTTNPNYKRPRDKAIQPFSPETNNISLDIGQVFLMGDVGSKYNDNLGFKVNYTYAVSELFGFNAATGYSNHSDGNFNLLYLTSGVRTNLAYFDRVIPHLNFGLGFYRPSYSFNNGNEKISGLLFGLHAGPGVNLLITDQFYFGANLTVHNMFGSNRTLASGANYDLGGLFTSFLVSAGYTL